MAVPFWVLMAGIVMTSVGIGRYAYLVNIRSDQRMASYWAQDSETFYRHMSVYGRGARPGGLNTPAVYINSNESLGRADISSIRTTLQNFADSGRRATGKGGLGADGRPVGWEDCFSSFLTAGIDTVPDVAGGSTMSFNSTTEVIAVEGNFTAFHPMMFMSGGFLPEIPSDTRQIVLNDVLAWKFYKSYDVIGNKVKLWGEEFTVIGVVAEPSDRISLAAGTGEPRVYVYFSAMETLAPLTDPGTSAGNGTASQGTTSSQTQAPDTPRPDMAILCYEAMLPELVRGVAKNDMSTALPNYTPATPNYYVISNTGRFGILDTWKGVMPIGEAEAKYSGYEFPYWEKTAKLTSKHLFADEALALGGVVVIAAGAVMTALRRHKMS
ncbi:MAG: ABC transporter permease [Clostridiales bacterium]|nr:ABC transporter permease [Clostridiales bacterium]